VNSDRQETSIDKVHSDWNGKCQPPDSSSNRNWNRNGNRIEIEPLALQLPFYVVGPKIRHRINLNTMQLQIDQTKQKNAFSVPKLKASSLPKSFDWLTKRRRIYGSIILPLISLFPQSHTNPTYQSFRLASDKLGKLLHTNHSMSLAKKKCSLAKPKQSRHIKKFANLALYSIIEFAYANFIPTTFNCNENTKTRKTNGNAEKKTWN